LFLSIPGKEATFKYSTTDNEGNFNFELPFENNLKDLIIQPEISENDFRIKIESPFSDKYPEIVTSRDSISDFLPENISQLGINYQVMKIYRSGNIDVNPTPLIKSNSKRFYGKPDIELIMSNYIKLPAMEEVFFELIPGVSFKKKRDEYEIRMVDQAESSVFEKPPLLFIDGVINRDVSLVANMDPDLVEKIDAIKTRYVVGTYIIHGLVHIITKAGDFSNFTLPDYAVRVQYNLTEPVKTFSSPHYILKGEPNKHIPDFRNTLYWNQSIKPDRNGIVKVEFYASDYISDYVVRIQGVSDDGRPVSLSKIIKIEK
jgi:hypothetical protein